MSKKRATESVILGYGGKGAVVRRRLPGGSIDQVCTSLYNIDVSRGCVAKVAGANLAEVFENEGYYSPRRDEGYLSRRGKLPNLACKYCYALGNNGGNIFPRVVNEKTRKSFEEHKAGLLENGVIRIGKLSEPGHPYYWSVLNEVLDLSEEYGSGIVMITKCLPFGLEGAIEADEISGKNGGILEKVSREQGLPEGLSLCDRFSDMPISILYSLGWDRLEGGLVSQGFTNQWRINQATKYHVNGVNTSLTVVCDVTSSVEDNSSRGSPLKEALRVSKDFGVNVRIIPLRPQSKLVSSVAIGEDWEAVTKGPTISLPGFERTESYEKKGSGNKERIPIKTHPDFEALMQGPDALGFCGRIGEEEFCDKCALGPRKRISFPVSELSPLPYQGPKRKRSNRKKKKSRKEEVDNTQGDLF